MARKGGAATKENGKSAAPAEMGSFREPLKQPETVGNLTVAETQEIKERRRLVEEMAKRIVDEQKVLGLLRSEHQQYLQGLLRGRGLSLQDDYNMDSEQGVIFRTARFVEPESVTVDNTEVVAQAEPEAGE